MHRRLSLAVTGWWITKATVWAVVLFLPLSLR